MPFSSVASKISHFYAEPGQEIAGNIFRTGVFGLAEQRMVASADAHEDGPCHSSHARCIRHGTETMFGGGYLFFKIVIAGIGNTAVGKAFGIIIACLDSVICGVEIKSRSLVNGRH